MRTRITASPLAARHFSASSALNTIAPQAAPGDAGRPLAITLRSALGIERRVQQLVERRRDRRAAPPPRSSISPSLRHVDGDAQRRLGGALAGARLQHVELAALRR